MGLRYRGRTKGKGAWINYSWSKKHGLGASVSFKFGPWTVNAGNGKSTKGRVTTNLGHGFYHVSENQKSRSPSNSQSTPTYISTPLRRGSHKPMWWLLPFPYLLAFLYFGWTSLIWMTVIVAIVLALPKD